MKFRSYKIGYFNILCWLFTIIIIIFLIFPLINLVFFYKTSESLALTLDPDIWYSLWITLECGLITSILGLIFGLPLAYALYESPSSIRGLIEPLVELPIILPPIIAGATLLYFISPSSITGGFFKFINVKFLNSINGIILGMFFVGIPFIVKNSLAAFQEIDPLLIKTATCLGATKFRIFHTIMLPYSFRNIVVGFTLMFGRSMGIFGTVVMLSNDPKTIPVLVYQRYLVSGIEATRTPALLLIVLCFAMYLIRRLLERTKCLK